MQESANISPGANAATTISMTITVEPGLTESENPSIISVRRVLRLDNKDLSFKSDQIPMTSPSETINQQKNKDC